jgi:hypothetical protein
LQEKHPADPAVIFLLAEPSMESHEKTLNDISLAPLALSNSLLN